MSLFESIRTAYIFLLSCSLLHAQNPLKFGHVSCNYSGITVEIILGDEFGGIIYSLGNFFNPSCSYIPSTGSYNPLISFSLPLMDCGTRIQELNGSIYVSNTITVQKHLYVESVLDVEHSITCQLSNNHLDLTEFWTAKSNPRKFTNDRLEAWMDVKLGTDIFGSEQPKELLIGDKFLLVIHLKDGGVHKDLRVDNCWAYEGDSFDGSRYALHLYNRTSCKTVEWLSEFKLTKGMINISDSLTYATVQAFKFQTSNKVHIACSVQVCKYGCFDNCNDMRFEEYNLTRSKRSNSKSSHNEDSLRRRYNLMKSTVKALGAKLIEKNKAQSLEQKSVKTNRAHHTEDESFLRRRISNTVTPNSTAEVIVDEKDSYVTLNNSQLDASSNSLEDYESESDFFFNEEYAFNLTYTIVVFKGKDFNFKYNQETNNVGYCIVNMKYVMLMASLCFITFCFFVACVGLALYLRKEKKRHKITEFLLYPYL